MEILRLRIELRALRHAINELHTALEKYSEAAHSTQDTGNKNHAILKPIPVTVSYSEQANAGQDRQNTTQEQIAKWTKRAVYAAIFYATVAAWQGYEIHTATQVSQKAISDNEAAQAAHLVIKSFDVTIVPGENFVMDVKYSIINVGHSVATNISVQHGGADCNHVVADCKPGIIDITPITSPIGPSLAPEAPGNELTGGFRPGNGPTDDVVSGRTIVSANIVVSYKDIFGNSYAVYECRSYDAIEKKFDRMYCNQISEKQEKAN